MPNSAEEWSTIAQGFLERANFPGCCGALDGKHINIQQPKNSGTEYFNYHGNFSTVLLAMVDSNYCFIAIDVGSKGRANDNSIFNESALKMMIENGSLHFPKWGVILGDDGFGLKYYLMKPFSRHKALTTEEKIFNYRLSRARRIVENAFGLLAMRFRIFCTHINLSPEKVDKIVKAACVIHNWLIKTNPGHYASAGIVDTENDNGEVQFGSWRLECPSPHMANIAHQGGNNYSAFAECRRQKYMKYFLNEGALPWQMQMIK